MNITVYCGVALGNDPAFEKSAKDLGKLIAERGDTLVFGGGGIGMMGALSDAAKEHGAHVIGIIPQFLIDREQLGESIDESVVVETMSHRKELLYGKADTFVMLPGGIGTFEEITEVLSQHKLGFIKAPVFIVNINGCYDHFVAALEDLVSFGFLRSDEAPYTVVTNIDELAELLP